MASMKASHGNWKRDNGNHGRGGNVVNTSTFHESNETMNNFEDRQNYLLSNSIGSNATVTVSSGVKYNGTLTAYNPSSKDGIEVILKFPRIVDHQLSNDDEAIEKLSNKLSNTLMISGSDVVELEIKDVDLSNDDKIDDTKINNNEKKNGFKTDVDISNGDSKIKERVLTKWTPTEEDNAPSLNQTLEESSSTWDQFAVNEAKFGIKSSYDEHFYTTKINRDAPNFNELVKKADKIAKEIESQGTSGNVHIAEDRGIAIDDSGLDEEDKYSGVDRRGDELLAQLKSKSKPVETKPNKYIPLTLRSQPHHVDPAIISSTSSKTPKEVQIDDLKKFAQKFKVPYKMPNDMKPSTTTKNVRNNESRPTSKRRSGLFFDHSITINEQDQKIEGFNSGFNIFHGMKKNHDENHSMEPFFISKPYFTAPTWDATAERSHRTLFPDEMTAVRRAQARLQQRQMSSLNSMNAAALANTHMSMAMNGMVRGPPGAGTAAAVPAPPGADPMMGMYMPFQPQPMFYPGGGMPHMIPGGNVMNSYGFHGTAGAFPGMVQYRPTPPHSRHKSHNSHRPAQPRDPY